MADRAGSGASMSEDRVCSNLQNGEPALPQRGPFVVDVTAGTTYYWCSCGLSKSQPWCDWSHLATDFKPFSFQAPISGEFHMCGCKKSQNKPFCYGTCRGHTVQNTKSDLLEP
jgi:CDGSH-type Zn-finger protein